MTKLEIDSQKKTMLIELALQGETEPIRIEVGAYSVEEVDGKLLLSVDKISTSRKWLTTLANEYLANRKIPIPKSASMAL